MRKIVQVARVQPGERVVEVGPGLGSLTLAILETGATVTAVEIDHRLAARLPETAAAHGVAEGALHGRRRRRAAGDRAARRSDRARREPPVQRLGAGAAALPRDVPGIQRGVVMVQAEVGERLAAPPGSKVYGAPSVKAAWYGPWRLAGTVSRQVFWPVPNVDSVLVAFTRDAESAGTEEERLRTFQIVDAAFQQRRKMLRQAVSGVLGGSSAAASAVLERAGVAPTARGEELSVEDFLRIARAS